LWWSDGRDGARKGKGSEESGEKLTCPTYASGRAITGQREIGRIEKRDGWVILYQHGSPGDQANSFWGLRVSRKNRKEAGGEVSGVPKKSLA